jgi:hypothetical protein
MWVGIAVALLTPVAGFVWNIGFDFARQRTILEARHEEATPAIRFVYAHFSKHGQWPLESELVAAGYPLGEPQWQYTSDLGKSGPLLWLRGPYHMAITYHFKPTDSAGTSDAWELSVEGSKSRF